jgi:Domain of unknown function (DUF4381)
VTGPLGSLHNFCQPPPPPWTPQTVGWYVLFAVIGLLVIWLTRRAIRRWIADRYRREALRELLATAPDGFSALLKRVALAAWPREKVASLNGDAWLNFLNETSGDNAFRHAPGNRIEEIALRPKTVSTEDSQTLREIVANWIRRHRVQV